MMKSRPRADAVQMRMHAPSLSEEIVVHAVQPGMIGNGGACE